MSDSSWDGGDDIPSHFHCFPGSLRRFLDSWSEFLDSWGAQSAKHLDSLEHFMELAIRDDGSVILLPFYDQSWLFVGVKQ